MIRVIYLHYPVSGSGSKSKKRPSWFDFERCFLNLLSTISESSVSCEINVFVDGSPKDNWILKYQDRINLIEFASCGGGAPLIKRIYDFIREQKWSKSDIIYILENDYLHVPHWPEHILAAVQTFGSDNYYSLYDHPDKYIERDYAELSSRILLSKDNLHWRTTPSTCFSFVTTRRLLEKDADIFLLPDMRDHLLFTMLFCAKGRKLFSPMPSLSTHCMEKWLSPGIDWETLSQNHLQT